MKKTTIPSIFWYSIPIVPLIIYSIRFWNRGFSDDPDMWHGYIAILIQAMVGIAAIVIANRAIDIQNKLAIALRKADLYPKFKAAIRDFQIDVVNFTLLCDHGIYDKHETPITKLHELQGITKEISECYSILFNQVQIDGFNNLVTFVDGYINQLQNGIPTHNPLDIGKDINQKHTIVKLQNMIKVIERYFIE